MDRDWLQIMEAVLVILGVGVWGLYGVGRYLMDWDVTERRFLPYHVAGVIPGMLLWQHRFLRGLIQKWQGRGDKPGS